MHLKEAQDVQCPKTLFGENGKNSFRIGNRGHQALFNLQ
jgi:hypothetical protein